MPEETATGTVADTYAQIRRIFGVPMVMLVYRALAVQPGRLEQVWDARANLACGETQRNAARLNPPEVGLAKPLPRALVAHVNLGQAQLAGTLAAFDRSNRLNLIGLTSLLEGTPGNADADRSQASLTRPSEMLPIADLASLPDATLDLLRGISASPIVGQQQPMLIPSLFRYFAHDEKLLRSIARSLGPLVESKDFPRAVATVSRDARDSARLLPYAVDRADDAGTREITTRFLTALPAMIVTTALLRVILGDLLSEDAA